MDAEQLLDDWSESHARKARQASPEFGVEDAARIEAHLAQAGEILAGRVQNPLLIGHERGELRKIADRGRIEEEGARTASEDLDEVGPLRIAEAGRTLGIDGEWTLTLRETRDGEQELVPRRDDMQGRMRLRFARGLGGGVGGRLRQRCREHVRFLTRQVGEERGTAVSHATPGHAGGG
jgi:hypothetical protein